MDGATFKFLNRFNAPQARSNTGSSLRLGPPALDEFKGDSMAAKLGRSLCDANCLRTKEFFESAEVFERVRKKIRARNVADLCCGHGLTGMLFAVFEPRVERVFLIDRECPPNHRPVLEAICRVAPWVCDKIEYRETTIRGGRGFLEPGTSIVAVHACGRRTDQCIDLALELGGRLAVLPCCYSRRGYEGSPALLEALDAAAACDIARTLRLEAAGYRVRWSQIPEEISRMRRLIVAMPKSAKPAVTPD